MGVANGKPFSSAWGRAWMPPYIPFGEEIKSGRVHRLIDLLRRAYHYRRQKFMLALDRPAWDAFVRGSTNESRRLIHFLTRNRRSNLTLSALMLTVSNGPPTLTPPHFPPLPPPSPSPSPPSFPPPYLLPSPYPLPFSPPYFGMNYAVAPEQRMDDGLLTVTVFSRYSKVQLWWHFASIACGRREYSPKAIAFRVAKLRVDSPRKLPVHLDGSPQKDLWPLDVECKQDALRVFRQK